MRILSVAGAMLLCLVAACDQQPSADSVPTVTESAADVEPNQVESVGGSRREIPRSVLMPALRQVLADNCHKTSYRKIPGWGSHVEQSRIVRAQFVQWVDTNISSNAAFRQDGYSRDGAALYSYNESGAKHTVSFLNESRLAQLTGCERVPQTVRVIDTKYNEETETVRVIFEAAEPLRQTRFGQLVAESQELFSQTQKGFGFLPGTGRFEVYFEHMDASGWERQRYSRIDD